MTHFVRQAAAVAAAFAICFPAAAADNATATATAEVLTPIAVAKTTDLVFGNLVPGNGVVTLSTTSVRTKDGSTGFSSSGAAAAAGSFTVTGTGANTFAIDYTGSSTTLVNGVETMAIDWITEAVATTATGKNTTGTNATTGTLSGGSARIFAGGALTVGAEQVSGTYTGSLKVTVAYN